MNAKANELSKNTGFPYWICVELVDKYLKDYDEYYFKIINGNYPKVYSWFGGRHWENSFRPNNKFAPVYRGIREKTKHTMVSYAIVNKDINLLIYIAKYGRALNYTSINFLVKFIPKNIFKIFCENLRNERRDETLIKTMAKMRRIDLLKIMCPMNQATDPKCMRRMLIALENKESFLKSYSNEHYFKIRRVINTKLLNYYFDKDKEIFVRMLPLNRFAKKINYTHMFNQLYEEGIVDVCEKIIKHRGRKIIKDDKWYSMIKHFKSYDNRTLVHDSEKKIKALMSKSWNEYNMKKYNFYKNQLKRKKKEVLNEERRKILRLVSYGY